MKTTIDTQRARNLGAMLVCSPIGCSTDLIEAAGQMLLAIAGAAEQDTRERAALAELWDRSQHIKHIGIQADDRMIGLLINVDVDTAMDVYQAYAAAQAGVAG